MDNNFLDEMKNVLLEQRKLIVAKSKEIVEDIDNDGDETDNIQANILLDVNKRLVTRDNLKFNQIEDALKRMQNHTYGLCEDCGDEIPEKRLTINPYFMTCISCAEQREMDLKRKRV
jgi:DnaK suppressor protein